MVVNGWKWLEMAGNCWKLLELVGNVVCFLRKDME